VRCVVRVIANRYYRLGFRDRGAVSLNTEGTCAGDAQADAIEACLRGPRRTRCPRGRLSVHRWPGGNDVSSLGSHMNLRAFDSTAPARFPPRGGQ